MEARTVIIIGNSLFAETLAQMLSKTGQVCVLGCVRSPAAALPLLNAVQPDAVILAGADRQLIADCGRLLATQTDLPIISADLNVPSVQVITSHRIGTRPADLLTALAELPKRS
jgi:DNA-binding NarL/FixJ family response regulator